MRIVTVCMVLVAVIMAGCVSVDYSFHPPDLSVQAQKEKEVCAPQFLFFGPAGTITVAQAMAEGGITKVRAVEHGRFYFLIAGAECTKVIGE